MAQNILRRDLGELQYSSGQVSELELPRSHYYQKLALLADYDVDVGSTTDNQSENGILELIDRIEVVINGNQTLKSTSFALSHFIDKYQYAAPPILDRLDHSSATNQTGEMQTFVDFALAPGDKSAMVPSFKLSDAVLRIKWGTDANVASDVTVNSASLQVQSKERLRSSVANSSEKEQEALNNLMSFKERERRKTLQTSGVSTVELPRGNVYYAAPYQVIDGDAPSNSLVESFEVVEDGVENHRAVDFDHARAIDAQEYNIRDRTDGFAYVNWGHRGDLTDVVSTNGMDAFELKVNTEGTSPTNPAHIRTVTQEIIR
jgi:hypothetical protein